MSLTPDFIDHLFAYNQMHKNTSRNELVYRLAELTFNSEEKNNVCTLADIRERVLKKKLDEDQAERFNEATEGDNIMDSLRAEVFGHDPDRD